MGDLSKNFSKWEFKCPCSECKHREIYINFYLVQKLEEIRITIGNLPIDITSGVRCEAENRRIGGYSDSPHIGGGNNKKR